MLFDVRHVHTKDNNHSNSMRIAKSKTHNHMSDIVGIIFGMFSFPADKR